MHILQSLDDSHDAHWEVGDLLRCFIIFCSLGLSADVSVRAELLPTPLSSSRKFCPVNRRAPSDWLRALSILLRLFWNTSRKQLLYSKHGSDSGVVGGNAISEHTVLRKQRPYL